MNLDQIARLLDLKLLTAAQDLTTITPTSGYASDLLSCVMSGAQNKGLWITLQAHGNIIAISALLELAAIIITENAQPDAPTIAKANEEGIILFSTPLSTYEIAGRLWEMGIRANPE